LADYGEGGLTVLPDSGPPHPVDAPASPDAFGAGVGRGLEHVGEGEQQLADVMTAHTVRMQELDNKSKTDAAWQDALKNTIGPLYGDYQNTQGSAAYEGYQDFADKLEAARKEGAAGLTNPRQHELYDEYSRRMTGYMLENGSMHAATERRQFINDTHTAKVQEFQQAGSAAWGDDKQFEDTQHGIAQEMYEQGHYMGSPDAKIEQDIKAAQSASWKNRLETMSLQGQSGRALQLYRQNIDKFTPSDSLAVSHALHSYTEADRVQRTVNAIQLGTYVGVKDLDKLHYSMEGAESSHIAGKDGPMTRHGQAHGLTQMLDGTGQDTAAQLGVPWRPDLMRGDTQEAIDYQRKLGFAHFDELLQKYGGNPAVALAAYNAGEGSDKDPRVDAWLVKNGDPTSGQVSTEEWINKIPFPETKAYVKKVLADAGGLMPNKVPTNADPTMELAGWDAKAATATDDPVFNNKVRMGLHSQTASIKSVQRAEKQQATDGLLTVLDGGPQRNQPKPTTIEQLFAIPGAKEEYAKLDHAAQDKVWKHLNDNAIGPTRDTPETVQHNQELKAMAVNDPVRFSQIDLMKEPNLTVSEKKRLQGMQLTPQKMTAHLDHALKIASDIPGVPQKYAPNKRNKGPTDQWNQFTGRMMDELENVIETRKHTPTDQEIRDITTRIVQQQPDPQGNWWWSKKADYELHPHTGTHPTGPKVPEEDAMQITTQFFKEYHRRPSEYEIGQVYARHAQREQAPKLEETGPGTDVLRSGGTPVVAGKAP
jgi:hypothetical protein